MNLPQKAALVALALLFVGPPAQAKSRASLLPFAGSYTGTATSTTAAGTLFGSSTMTFTGRKTSLRGTFLYTGILNSGNVSKNVVQTFNISKHGALNGRVTVDGIEGLGSGQAQMRGRKLIVSVTYVVGAAPATSITISGAIVFKGKHAKWTGVVTSSDASYDGTLSVAGKR